MIMEDWKEYTVQELIDKGMLAVPMDGNHGEKHPKTGDYVPTGVPFIMANNLIGGTVDLNNCAFISETQANSLDKGFAKPGDVLITHKATIGRTAIVPNDYDLIVLTPQVTYYRPIKGIDNRYLKYYFDTDQFQRLFKNWAGAGSTRAYLGITAQRKLPIILPDIGIQKRISSILKSLDDKIELNRRINEKLEQQAQALFKSWFVDFEPFKDQPFVESELGMIPQGWRVESLSSIADYVNGLAMQKYRPEDGEEGIPVLKIKELGQGNIDDSSELCSPSVIGEKYIINDGDIIFSWSGTLMVKVWCGGKCGLNQHLFVVNPKDYPKWLVYHWTKYHLDNFIRIAKDKAVTMGHIKRGELDKAKTIIPDKENMQKIDALIKPIFEQIIANELESRRLAELRDTLLPRLMSGELKVNDVI